MCGIVGLWTRGGTPSTATLEQMSECLAHRGPEAEGSFVEGPVGVGHRRLAIVDPETGDQPIFNESDDVVVVFNGEIYNYRALRTELEAEGHRFTTDTDTEVLVHLYEEYGTEFVDELDGMFAFALYDRASERLVLARDLFGIKPLVIADDGETIAFASEIPALFDAPVELGGLDERAIATYFGIGYIPSPLAAFENVSKLRPGERIVVEDGSLSRDCFATPEIPARNSSIDTAATELHDRLKTAVQKRLMADVPLGAFLSGGIDSSIVVSLLSDLTDEPVKTFTVGFERARFDESWAARAVSDHLGTDHTEFTCSPETVRELVPSVLSRLGEPFADPSLLPTFVVARETSTDVTVALSGDAGDELFAGYDKYRGEYISEYYRQIPSSIRNGLLKPIVNRFPASRGSSLGEVGRKLQTFSAADESDLARRHVGWLRIADDEALKSVRTKTNPLTASEESIREAEKTVRAVLPLDRQDAMAVVQGIDTRHSLPDQLLTKVDLASMYNSLEVRVPFLDPSVVSYAFSLPRSAVITPRDRKRVLKRAFADELPKEILTRSKQGFDMPIGEWFKGPLAEDFETVIAGLDTNILDTASVRTAYEDHCAGRAERSKFLWAVYVFARWHSRLQDRGVLD